MVYTELPSVPPLTSILNQATSEFIMRESLNNKKCSRFVINANTECNIENFYKFLKTKHCEENLDFFISAKNYLLLQSQTDKNNAPSKVERLRLWNKDIYMKFIAVNSVNECSFPYRMRIIFDNCYKNNTEPYEEDVAMLIRHTISTLFDGYHRFIRDLDDCINNGTGISFAQAIKTQVN